MSTGYATKPVAPADVFMEGVAALADTISGMIEMKAPKGKTAKPKELLSEAESYDPITRSWLGEEGLRYRVPLIDIPGEAHTRNKTRNIRVVCDNVRRMCVNDLLPCTEEEKVFWTKYRFIKYQLFLMPFIGSLPFTYAVSKLAFNILPRAMKGRSLSVGVSFIIADFWQEATFPAHSLLSTAIAAKTPLGDAARADWQRMQPYTIPPVIFAAYNFKLVIGAPMEELCFGGDASAMCS